MDVCCVADAGARLAGWLVVKVHRYCVVGIAITMHAKCSN